MADRFDLHLDGCTPEPLASYLKAVGIHRLVAEQRDADAHGYWKGEVFQLRSGLDRDGLVEFFLTAYQPTPVVSPWSGGSGFFAKDNKEALTAIKFSGESRFGDYRETIDRVERILGKTPRDKPSKEEKAILLSRYRAELPDRVLSWLDAALVLTVDAATFAPVLGTGGNDGRLDFSRNFMDRLVDVLSLAPGAPAPAHSEARLRLALFGEGEAPLASAAVGQFDPGGVGGPNAEPGFEAGSLINPWDYILMIEGAMLLAGAVARRLGSEGRGRAAFPFTVSSSAAGWATISDGEPAAARAELWLPLWSRAASLPEVAQLFAEGRAQVGRRQSRSGVDFARSVAGLGVDRGISAFQRYGFLRRSGKNYLAAPLGRFAVRGQEHVGLLDELDLWLGRLRRAWSDGNGPASWRRALRGIEEAIFAYCEFGGARRLARVLEALGRAEQYLALARKDPQDKLSPLSLSGRWLAACDDGTTEYRIAAALASIDHPEVGPIRGQLEPVVQKGKRPDWSQSSTDVAWAATGLPANLVALLERRHLMLEQGTRKQGQDGRTAVADDRWRKQPPIEGRYRVSLADVQRFLAAQTDDGRLSDLLWGLAAVRWADVKAIPVSPRPFRAPELPRLYALLKLLYLPHPLAATDEGEPVAIRAEPAMLSRLRAGDTGAAVSIACRRLRASGLQVLGATASRPPDFACSRLLCARLPAALLIPIWQIEELGKLVLRPAAVETEAR